MSKRLCTEKGLIFGGAAYDGSAAGFVYSSSAGGPSHAFTTVGSRLCFMGA